MLNSFGAASSRAENEPQGSSPRMVLVLLEEDLSLVLLFVGDVFVGDGLGEVLKGFGCSISAERHVPTQPPNTEFNSVFRQRLKMRLSPKLKLF